MHAFYCILYDLLNYTISQRRTQVNDLIDNLSVVNKYLFSFFCIALWQNRWNSVKCTIFVLQLDSSSCMRSVHVKEYVTVSVHSMHFLSYAVFGTNIQKRKKYNGLQIKKQIKVLIRTIIFIYYYFVNRCTFSVSSFYLSKLCNNER